MRMKGGKLRVGRRIVNADKYDILRRMPIRINHSEMTRVKPVIKHLPCPVGPGAYRRNTLCVSLDETLMFATTIPMERQPDEILELSINVTLYVYFRPHMITFLEFVKSHFELVIYGSLSYLYTKLIADSIGLGESSAYPIYSKENCYLIGKQPVTVKNIADMGRDLKRIILLDTRPSSWLFTPHNGLPIKRWMGSPLDTSLLRLIGLMSELATTNNVIDVLDAYLCTPEMLEIHDPTVLHAP